jgi:trehalose 6-phosphate synthase/phosphatase
VNTPKIDVENQLKIVDAFQKAKRKAILLDYDGTLVPFHENPEAATPDQQLIELLQTLCKQPNTDLAIISGRDQSFMSHWLGDLTLTLVAEHGHYVKPKEKKWKGLTRGDKQWMSDIMPIFESFMDRTPGTFIEEKHNSLVWHYRKTDPELAAGRVVELKTVLSSLISDQLSVMDMDKALEVVDRQIDKGTVVTEIIGQNHYDFILCIGDDVTDENMFSALPDSAFTIKVGKKPTVASYSIEGVSQVKELLDALNITRLE